MLFFLKDTMTSRDLKGSVPFIVDEGGADDSELDHVYENATENTTENTIETMSPQTQQSTPRRVFKSPTKKKIKRPKDMSDFDDKLLRIEEEKLKLFKQNTQDSEMQFLMSLHPFLKQIPSSRQLAVRANIMQFLMNEATTSQYLPSPSQSYQSSSDDWRSECSTSQSGATNTVIRSSSQMSTLPRQQEFLTDLDILDF